MDTNSCCPGYQERESLGTSISWGHQRVNLGKSHQLLFQSTRRRQAVGSKDPADVSGREVGKDVSVSCHRPWTRIQRALAKFSLVLLRAKIYEKVFPNLILLFPWFLCLHSGWVSFQQGVQLTKMKKTPDLQRAAAHCHNAVIART